MSKFPRWTILKLFSGRLADVEPPPILKEPADFPDPSARGRGEIIFIIHYVWLLGAGMFFALRKKQPPITVQTEKVARHNITETVVANGKIYPVLQVHISPEVSGEIIDTAGQGRPVSSTKAICC